MGAVEASACGYVDSSDECRHGGGCSGGDCRSVMRCSSDTWRLYSEGDFRSVCAVVMSAEARIGVVVVSAVVTIAKV